MSLKKTLLLAAFFGSVAAAPFASAQDTQTRLRLICVSALKEEQKVILASRDAEGKWSELATVVLRTSLVSDWLPAPAGELHLAVREDGALKSIGTFTCPEGSRSTLVALIAEPKGKSYESHVVDPHKAGFEEGSMLILNLSPHAATVSLGDQKHEVAAGQQLVAKPALKDPEMFRMMVSHSIDDGKPVVCYDRQTSSSPTSRKILFLLPDKTLGLRVLSQPLFGDLE